MRVQIGRRQAMAALEHVIGVHEAVQLCLRFPVTFWQRAV